MTPVQQIGVLTISEFPEAEKMIGRILSLLETNDFEKNHPNGRLAVQAMFNAVTYLRQAVELCLKCT